jgi:hypothetical protein
LGATHADYRDWLVEELAAFGEPVDLVGHDVGGGHVVNVVLSPQVAARVAAGQDEGLGWSSTVWVIGG